MSCACGTRTAFSGFADGAQAHGAGTLLRLALQCVMMRLWCARSGRCIKRAAHDGLQGYRAVSLTGAAVTPAACSSSFMALNDAVSDLQNGRTDYAMVGGSSALFRPATTVAFNQLQCARAPRPLVLERDALACTWLRGLLSAALLSYLQQEQPWPSTCGNAAEPVQSYRRLPRDGRPGAWRPDALWPEGPGPCTSFAGCMHSKKLGQCMSPWYIRALLIVSLPRGLQRPTPAGA